MGQNIKNKNSDSHTSYSCRPMVHIHAYPHTGNIQCQQLGTCYNMGVA